MAAWPERVERARLKSRTKRARGLRAGSTDAERKLWSLIRGRRLAGAKFRRQQPIDRYFADFACFEARLVVELDGSQHDSQAGYDAARTRVMEGEGWRVIRFWSNHVLENPDGVAEAILTALGQA